MDRTKDKISKQTLTNSTSMKELSNPFFKRIDRHYGSFRTRLLGNYRNVFNCLPFRDIKPLNTCRRKVLNHRKLFTAIFYSNGTVEIKPVRMQSCAGNAHELLDADLWAKARLARDFIESKGCSLGELSMNRLPKYGVEDAVARRVGGEFHGQFRSMDKSPGHGHVDNKGKQASIRDSRLSSGQHERLAELRLEQPELLESIELKLDAVFATNSAFAKNIDLHLGVEERKLAVTKLLHALLGRLEGYLKPKRARAFKGSFKKSATVRGCN